MDVPAPSAGTVTQLRVSIGDRVSEGSVLMTLEVDGAARRRTAPVRPRRPRPRRADERRRPRTRRAAAPQRRRRPRLPGGGAGFRARAATRPPSGPPTSACASALVERYERLGGVCLNVGCIPSKALLHAARVIAEAEEMAAHGISFGRAGGRLGPCSAWKTSVVDKLTGGLDGLAKQRQVEVVHGVGAVHRARRRWRSATARSRFENCIIAAGSQAAKLPGLPDDPRVIDSTGALSPGDRSQAGCW